jgi:hypothetical protein
MKNIIITLNLIGLLFLFLLNQCVKTVYTTVIERPVCADEPCELVPGESFKVRIGKYAEINTFSVKAECQDRDTDIRLDLTEDFEPKPFETETLVSATPPSFQMETGVHGGIWKLIASADGTEESSNMDIRTQWITQFKPYRVRIQTSSPIELTVGQQKSISLNFPAAAVEDMVYLISPQHDEVGDNMDAVVINQANPSDEVSITLRKDSDQSSFRITGNETGSISLLFSFPGGVYEKLRVNVE